MHKKRYTAEQIIPKLREAIHFFLVFTLLAVAVCATATNHN